jgi:DNA polymerase III delta prime subunit
MLHIDKHPTHIVIGDESVFTPPGNKQSVVYISPEKNYVLEDIEVIFEKTKFALEPGTNFCFVLTKADRLTSVCANKLLKLLEEPPAGYLFFLLTNNENAILPTIRSRAYIHHLGSREAHESSKPLISSNTLISFLIDAKKRNDFLGFEQELKKQAPSEAETTELIYELLSEVKNDEQKRTFLEQTIRKPPQAGGAMLFWKKLFLTFPRP